MQRHIIMAITVATLLFSSAEAQQRERPPEFASTEISDKREITFRLFAAKAETVRLVSPDLPMNGANLELKKGENGVWELTTPAVPAGAYRYNFDVDGLAVIDPRNGLTSESNMNAWSLVLVPGSDVSDLREVPHGAVAQVNYYSKSLGRFRRFHVYTPPGYESSAEKYPVFYLLHGAFDTDAAWSTVGQAGPILDNLIAAHKAPPMIVVMPMGHTGPFSFGPGSNFEKQMEEFTKDFREDLRPFVEQRYRILADRDHRAIAGLSMGGAQTLNIALLDPQDFGYVGVFSSGVFGIERPDGPAVNWERDHFEVLDNAEYKQGLKLMWFATGKEDFLLNTSKATVDVLKKHGFDVQYDETDGGHTWLNWRDYLHQFAQKIFTDTAAP